MKVLVIGLGQQGEKYINYFIKNNYEVFGVCKTLVTKDKIENKYDISVNLSDDYIDYSKFDIVIVSLPPEIQGKISLEILKGGFTNKLIIEIPVTWNKKELEELKKYDNVYFFLEEYYTLLAKFLRKIDISKLESIEIDIKTHKNDYLDELARKVTYIHINNNFIGSGVKLTDIDYSFAFHDREDIFYTVCFNYNGVKVLYNFDKEKYLIIGDKKYSDNYNFDFVLSNIINEKNNFSKFYNSFDV